ncbi:MAG: hypothetical protein U0796_09920 [Gemmatales bacterium]
MLANKYNFNMYNHPSFATLDVIGKRLSHRQNSIATNMFRKFAVFDGPFNTFAYFDADTLILDSLLPRLQYFSNSSIDFIFAHSSPEQVYKPVFWEQQSLLYGSLGFNAGIWISRQHVLNIADVIGIFADEAECLKNNFAPTWDQPFFNYCIDHSNIKKCHFSEFFRKPHLSLWPGECHNIRNGRLNMSYVTDTGHPVILVHWAGYKIEYRMPYRWLFEEYRFGNMCINKLAWRMMLYYRHILNIICL